MKPLWTQTLAWIAAIAAALLLAMMGPETVSLPDAFPHGASTPR
jgi:hypothetical protein